MINQPNIPKDIQDAKARLDKAKAEYIHALENAAPECSLSVGDEILYQERYLPRRTPRRARVEEIRYDPYSQSYRAHPSGFVIRLKILKKDGTVHEGLRPIYISDGDKIEPFNE